MTRAVKAPVLIDDRTAEKIKESKVAGLAFTQRGLCAAVWFEQFVGVVPIAAVGRRVSTVGRRPSGCL